MPPSPPNSLHGLVLDWTLLRVGVSSDIATHVNLKHSICFVAFSFLRLSSRLCHLVLWSSTVNPAATSANLTSQSGLTS